MTYTPTGRSRFWGKQGTLAEKITDEFSSIASELNRNVKVVEVALTSGLANAFALA